MTKLHLVAPAMGRPVSDFLNEGYDPRIADESVQANSWGLFHITDILPDSDETDLTARLLAPLGTCFKSVEDFSTCATSLHQWLCGLGGREGMMHLWDIIRMSSETYGETENLEEAVVTEALEDILSKAADHAVERCTFKILDFAPDHVFSVTIYESQLHLDLEMPGEIRPLHSIDIVEEEEDDGIVTGSDIPMDIKGRIDVLEIQAGRQGMALKVNVFSEHFHETYGPLLIFDKEIVEEVLCERRSLTLKRSQFECVIAKPNDASAHPIVISAESNHSFWNGLWQKAA